MPFSSNIEAKLKEYRYRKEAELKFSYHESIWERFIKKFKTSNKNITSACGFAENALDCSQQSAVVNHAEELESRNCFSHEKRKVEKRYVQQRKAQSNEVKQVSPSTQLNSLQNQTTHIFKMFGRSDTEIKWFLLFLKIVLWIVLFVLCLELECGAIYVIFSVFYLMLKNFRNGQRKPWEPSAYSVFNPGCEAIDGTLKPEQFEKEIRYGF